MANPCLYSGLISRNLNLCYVLSTISNMVKFSRDDNYIVFKKETVFWGRRYILNIQSWCVMIPTTVCFSVCSCGGEWVSVGGGKRKKRWKEGGRERVRERETYLLGGSRWRLYILFFKIKIGINYSSEYVLF